MNELTNQTNESGKRSGRALNELSSRAPIEFVERVGYVSLTNRADFYSNDRVSTVSSSSSDRAKPRGYQASCRTDWFIYVSNTNFPFTSLSKKIRQLPAKLMEL